jgi:hypothetical protein
MLLFYLVYSPGGCYRHVDASLDSNTVMPSDLGLETTPMDQNGERRIVQQSQEREAKLESFKCDEYSYHAGELFMTTLGSATHAYYEDNILQILKVYLLGETFRVEVFYYPFDDYLIVICNDIRYSQHVFWEEGELREYPVQRRMIIKNSQLYYFIDAGEPLYTSDNNWYAEIYAKAVEALNQAAAGG